MPKRGLGINVLEAAQDRIRKTFNSFGRIYVSFSGGKDSSVLLHLAVEEARRRNRKIGALFVDLEAQYTLTIEHVEEYFRLYADCIDPYWICLPLHLRNACSQFEPQWICWEPGREADWVRTPPEIAITDEAFFPWFRRAMEFEELVVQFGDGYAQRQNTACLVGIRTQESLNRWRSLAGSTGWTENYKNTYSGWPWTTQITASVYNAYPIYDWRTEDIWTYHARTGAPYNKLYDRMYQAGLTIHQMRICQPYGDDQRKGLWLYHLIEPETWGRVVARVNGANSGALYVRETGNIMGYRKVTCPDGMTWEQFANNLLDSMPPKTAEHFRNKIAVFVKWWMDRGYSGGIPDDNAYKTSEGKNLPSWKRICKTLLRYDYWCKGLSFNQHTTGAYERYQQIMKKRREKWGIYGSSPSETPTSNSTP